MVYTVTNTDERTQRFFPMFQLVTEDFTVVDTDMGISKLVFEAIRERHRATHPYLVHPTEAIGEIGAGDDNAIESVAIWRGSQVKGNSFTIYAAGLSGETRYMKNPAHEPGQPEELRLRSKDGRERTVQVNPRFFPLRKTLEIRYTLPGSAEALGNAAPQRDSVRWIMR
jgi:hypothetical protein